MTARVSLRAATITPPAVCRTPLSACSTTTAHPSATMPDDHRYIGSGNTDLNQTRATATARVHPAPIRSARLRRPLASICCPLPNALNLFSGWLRRFGDRHCAGAPPCTLPHSVTLANSCTAKCLRNCAENAQLFVRSSEPNNPKRTDGWGNRNHPMCAPDQRGQAGETAFCRGQQQNGHQIENGAEKFRAISFPDFQPGFCSISAQMRKTAPHR